MVPIRMQLSKQQKTLSEFFAAFLKSSLNFKHFAIEDDPQRDFVFSKLRSPKK